MARKKTVSLVLGSGGARGIAHIGVIRWLEENDFEIRSISGCSIGALVGGIYAAGKLDVFEQWVCAITKMKMISLLDVTFGSAGLLKGEKVINTLAELTGDLMIEDLSIPYTAVAADIENEKEVWINSGKLFDAIRASISLPFILTPYNLNGVTLVDGGVLNPVPIAPVFSDNNDLTIAVNLGGSVEKKVKKIKPKEERTSDAPKFHKKIDEFINRLKLSEKSSSKFDLGYYDVANQSFDAMQSTIARQKLAAYPPDHTIEIARNACGTMEFDRSREMKALGYKKAESSLNHLL